MILTKKEISEITFGALRITEEDGAISFDRFTEGQLDYYEATNEGYYTRANHSASILLDFFTDSEKLSFDYKVTHHAKVESYYFDVYENDMMILHSGHDTVDVCDGKIEVALSKGIKRVRVYFPFSQKAHVWNFTLDDGAAVIKRERALKALVLGDSITQGYHAKYPSLSYSNLMIERYSFDFVNQAIGGERFNADMLGDTKIIEPDVITVAMGINDWVSYKFDEIEKNADKYFSTLKTIYENVPIIYISPIWIDREGNDTMLLATIEMLESVAISYGAYVIHGLDLVPHDKGMFSDGVHPTDLGFSEYAKRLFPRMDSIIESIKKLTA